MRLSNILEVWVSDDELLDELSEDTNLISDLGLDSVGVLQVILSVEKEFGVSINVQEYEAETFSVFGRLVGLVETKKHETV